MNRKQFLRGCATGLCGCVAAGAIPPGGPSAAEAAPAEDWRQRFVRRRYAKLMEILSSRVDEKALNETLHDLGSYCSTTDEKVGTFRGNFDGYREHLKQTASGDTVAFDREKGLITVTSPERADCFCPLVSVQDKTPQVVCNCSLGWHQRTWQTVLGKKVQVELKESVLRGGRRCSFQVHVSDESV
jgi:predicted ArsR family transcriptional regulator